MPTSHNGSFDAGHGGSTPVDAEKRRRGWLGHCSSRLDGWMGALVGLVAPSRCAACGRQGPAWGGIKSVLPRLCEECEAAALPPEGNRCGRCGAPVGPFIDATEDCIHCRADRFHFETVIRLGIYESELGRMCRCAKRPRREELAAALANLLWKHESQALRAARTELVIPVPHRWQETLSTSPPAPETLAAVLARRLR